MRLFGGHDCTKGMHYKCCLAVCVKGSTNRGGARVQRVDVVLTRHASLEKRLSCSNKQFLQNQQLGNGHSAIFCLHVHQLGLLFTLVRKPFVAKFQAR